jgi:hypothetical protein
MELLIIGREFFENTVIQDALNLFQFVQQFSFTNDEVNGNTGIRMVPIMLILKIMKNYNSKKLRILNVQILKSSLEESKKQTESKK